MSQRNARLVAISPQSQANNRELVEKYRLKFEILRDEANAYADQLDLVHGFDEDLREVYLQLGVDLAEVNGEPSWTLPIPTQILVDTDQKILHVQLDADYKVRPEPENILTHLTASGDK